MPIVVDDVYVDESRPFAHFTIRLTQASTLPVSFSYNNSNETAANGSDYVAKSGTLTFAPGQTVLTLDIPLIGNTTLERTESFLLNLFNPVNATIATPFARATIFDNDQPAGTPIIRVSDQIVDEASGQVAFVVTLDRPSAGTVSVIAATQNGSALAGSDYVAATQTLTFAPGETAKVVNVSLVNDTSAEAREFFDLRLSSAVGATLLPQPTGRAFIGANDAAAVPLPSITVSDAVADEKSTYLEFVVSLNAPSAQTVSVAYNNSNVTAFNGSDYFAESSTLTFLPGETTKVVKIPVLDTAGIEPSELLALNLLNPVNASIGRPFALGTIVDNDQTSGTPVIRVADQVVDEASGQVSFVVTLDKPSLGNVSVSVATSNGTALAGSDFVAPATQILTFLPGEMVKVVDVALINDTTAETREFFDLRLSSASGGTLLTQPTGRAFIGANDAAAVPFPSITVSDAVADESGTALEFVVSLSAPSAQAVSVVYNNSNVTALNGSDYFALSSTLTFAPGETTKVVKIPVMNTAGIEPSELLALNLLNPVNASIGRPFALGTIVDNDQTSGTPVIRVADQVVDEASGQVSFAVTLDKPSLGTVTVSVATSNGTALAGSDFVAPATQMLTFLPGEMVKVVDVALINDTTAETREFFDLRLSAASGGTLLAQPAGRAFIGANDAAAVPLPSITVSDAVADESSTALEFVVSLSAPSAQAVSVVYNNSNVTALNGSDYFALSSTLTFAPGETTKVVKIPVMNTAGLEPSELVALNLLNPVNASIGRPLAYGTIVDNDQTSGTPVIRVADQVVDEASGQVSFVVTLDKPSLSNVTVNVATADGSALSSSDYAAFPTQTLTFLPGEVAKVVDVALTNDTTNEPGEFFDLRLSSPFGAALPDTNARAFIAPSDAAPIALPRILVSNAVADESNTALEFIVSLSAPSAQAVSVGYNNSNVTAANGSDYVAQGSTITFAPGETTKVVKIPVLDGLVAEPSELLALNLFNPVNATIARPPAIGTIVDNDATSGTPVVSVTDGIVDESAARAAFAVTLDKPSLSQVTVSYATADGNAAAGSDYETQAAQTLVFGPGETSKTVYVNLLGDTAAEGPEFFDLSLSSAGNATIGDARGHMVIPQSDTAVVAQPVISAAAIAAPEAGTYLEFIVSLSAPSAQLVSVGYNNSNGTAANGSDYVALSGNLTFLPGETVQTVRIPVMNDIAVEATESFGLNLLNPVNALIGTTPVAGAILDNDGPPLGSQFVNNGTGNADVLVGRPGSNAVVGGSGDDVLDGVDGVSMSGGIGNDLYIVEAGTDTVTEASGAGTDTVVSYFNYTLGANVENLILRGSALTGTGNTLNNSISGNSNANTLDGGLGADSLAGGDGNDIYVVDSIADLVIETNATAAGGIDQVNSTVTTTLSANVENLVLASAGAINGTGNTLNNVITAGAGNNVIDGGAGVDTASYASAASGVTVNLGLGGAQATGGSAFDTLLGVENLTGSNFNDTLTGNSAANVLNGGLGVDTMVGGDGSDSYFVDVAGDVVTETNAAAAGGVDQVSSSISYTLGANVENLNLTGAGAINGTGNALANVIAAGAGNNVIDGGAGVDTVSYVLAGSGVTVNLSIVAAQATGGSGSDTLLNTENLTGSNFTDTLTGNTAANTINGGLGTDTMAGGDGNDIYFVDASGDVVIETNAAAAGGIDEVRSGVTWTLGANVENLTLTGTGAINGTGNALANALTGNSAANTLTGGLGVDTFTFNNVLAIDTLTDFASGVDKLRISQAGIVVGDGDQLVENGAVRTAPGGFTTAAELVVFTTNIVGSITTSSAATQIGSALTAYAAGAHALFAVDNGTQSGLFLFQSSGADAVVSAAELTQVAVLNGQTALADYVFGP